MSHEVTAPPLGAEPALANINCLRCGGECRWAEQPLVGGGGWCKIAVCARCPWVEPALPETREEA